MINVNGVLLSDELIEQYFCCDMEKCMGACCIEGDMGAPLDPLEISDLDENYPVFKKYMTEEGIRKIEDEGTFDYDTEGSFVTPLLSDESCAYVYYDSNGVVKCAIEKAYQQGEIDFPKPVSCHLYPIRIKQLPDYEALNYHHWLVCIPACHKGREQGIPVYRFLKEPLIRKYGPQWYEDLEKIVNNNKP